MSLATNAVIILLVSSLIVTGVPGVVDGIGCQYGLNCQTVAQAFLSGNGSKVTDFLTVSLFSSVVALAAALAVAGQLGLISFPNPYVIFGAFVTAIIVNWSILPFQLFNSLPAPVNIILTGAFSFAIYWGIFQFYHGTGES